MVYVNFVLQQIKILPLLQIHYSNHNFFSYIEGENRFVIFYIICQLNLLIMFL